MQFPVPMLGLVMEEVAWVLKLAGHQTNHQAAERKNSSSKLNVFFFWVKKKRKRKKNVSDIRLEKLNGGEHLQQHTFCPAYELLGTKYSVIQTSVKLLTILKYTHTDLEANASYSNQF